MKILITGGAGFIGSHLAMRLSNHDILILDSFSPQVHGSPEGIAERRQKLEGIAQVHTGDVRDYNLLAPLVRQADAIVHLVAETGVGQSMYDVQRYVSVNDMGSATLMEALVKEEHNVRKLLLTSSRAVYGECAYQTESGQLVVPQPRSPQALEAGQWEPTNPEGHSPIASIPTPVTTPPHPASIYGVTKYNQELICGVLGEMLDLSVVILRLFNVYGEGQSLNNPYTGILTVFANRIEQNLAPLVYEDGLESRDFVHVEDVVSAITLALESQTLSNGRHVYNVGSGDRTTIYQLAETMIAAYEKELIPIITGQYRVGDIRHAVADISDTCTFLNYEPEVTLASGVQRFIEWASSVQREFNNTEKASEELKRYGLLGKAKQER
jgi:dTDP-L-rhamnose 4-epimerase